MAKTTVFYNGVRDIEFEIADKSGMIHTVVIKGSGAGLRGANAQPLPAVGAYGATVVDADMWAAIKEAYAEHPAFKGGFVRTVLPRKRKKPLSKKFPHLITGKPPRSVTK